MINKPNPINKTDHISIRDSIKPKFTAFPEDCSAAENDSKRLIYFKQNKIIQSEKKLSSADLENSENKNPNIKLSQLLKKYRKKDSFTNDNNNNNGFLKADFLNFERFIKPAIRKDEIRDQENISEDSIRKIDFEKEEGKSSSENHNSNKINCDFENSKMSEIDKVRKSDWNTNCDYKANSANSPFEMDVEIDYNFQSSTLRNSKNFPLKASLNLESIGKTNFIFILNQRFKFNFNSSIFYFLVKFY